MLVGMFAYQLPAAVGASRGRLPDDPGADVLPGRQSRCDDLVSVTAPLEVQFGQMPGLNQMSSTSSAGASVITLQFSLALSLDVAEQEVQAAINAAGNLLPLGSAGAADLRQGQSCGRADPDAGVDLENDLADPGPGPRRHAPRAENLPIAGGRAGQRQRRSASGGAHPGKSDRQLAAYGLNIDDLRTTLANANVNTPEGQFRRAEPSLHDQRQ